MQINLQEISAIQGFENVECGLQTVRLDPLQAFHLPTLHNAVQLTCLSFADEPGLAHLARMLLEIGIIDPKDVPDHATSVQEVVEYALGAWIDKRAPKLNQVQISMRLVRPETVHEMFEHAQLVCHDDDDDEQMTRNDNYKLAILGTYDYYIYELNQKALGLELVQPGLFKTAMMVIRDAANITVDINLPDDMLNHYRYMWEGWEDKGVPTDTSARESLLDRFGEESPEIDELIPSQIIPLLGGDLCLTTLNKSKRISEKQLLKIADRSSDNEVIRVAQQTVKLLRLIKQANDIDAEFPTLDGIDSRPYESGCTLVYQYEERIHAVIDERFQSLMECGDGDELLGVGDLPETSEELKTYFEKLDISLKVIQEMDNLIGMIAIEAPPLN